MRIQIFLASLAWLSTAAPRLAEAAPDYETLAAELARLRTDVESISAQIDDEKERTRAELRTLASQKTSLDAEIQREELRSRQLALSLEEIQARIRTAGALQREVEPAIYGAIEAVRAPIAAGIPFRVPERLAELDRLERGLRDAEIAPASAVVRLWALVEDELRLTRENGLYQQIIQLSGEEILADVARVGMLMMYFRTPDDRYGYARSRGGAWSYALYQTPDDQEQVAALFTSLQKRVRVGFFELPNALPEQVVR